MRRIHGYKWIVTILEWSTNQLLDCLSESTKLPYKEYDAQTDVQYTPFTVKFVDWHWRCLEAIKSGSLSLLHLQHHSHPPLVHQPPFVMVLGNKNGNNKPRACSNDQNIPLHISTARTLAHRLRGSAEVARRYGRPNNVRPTPSAIRRGKRKLPTTPLSVQVGVTDVQRVENPVTPQGAQMSLISVARHLIRPEFEAIDPESIKDHVKDIDADVTKVPLDVLKMTLNSFAPQ